MPITQTGQDPASLQTGDAASPNPRVARSEQFAEAIILAILIAVPALFCLRMAIVGDADIWWHLRTGQWILQHHGVPHTDPFTRFGAGKPWAAYSWLYELLVFKCFQRLGLVGIVAYSTGMVLAIAAAIYHLLRRLQPDFSIGALLTLVATLSLTHLYTPRSWLFTILFFVLELDILMHARKTGPETGMPRELLWLPPLFALWANVHIQFFDGLLVMGLALGEAILARWFTSARTRLAPAWIGGVFLACILATLANPYGWKIYEIGFRAATQPGILSLITEFHALEFRALADYCMLFLALAAAGALAWRRRFPLFETALLIFAAVVSFRSGRDMWVMVIAAAAILAQRIGGHEKVRRPLAAFAAPLVAVVIGLLLFLGTIVLHTDNPHLRAILAQTMPVRAVEVAKDEGFNGPLYNNLDWGGYLIWQLRMPVSIDGRNDLIGDQRIERSFATWDGGPGWASDPDLTSAKLVIGPASAPLTQLLQLDPHFVLVFEDKVAAVFIARNPPEKPEPPITPQ